MDKIGLGALGHDQPVGYACSSVPSGLRVEAV